MRKLNRRLLISLRVPETDDNLIATIGEALHHVRGRKVLLREVAFPPHWPSGLWVDQSDRDVIAYEANARPEHQLVIIGHEIWHMFEGHCDAHTDHGPAALRALGPQSAEMLHQLSAILPDIADELTPASQRMDAALHVAARSSGGEAHKEEQAELFGIQFATALQAALTEARTTADPTNLVGRIQASMAHRFQRP